MIPRRSLPTYASGRLTLGIDGETIGVVTAFMDAGLVTRFEVPEILPRPTPPPRGA